MMGSDQDDIVIAPWTTIKYRVNAGLNNAGLSISSTSSSSINTAVNSLSNLYPTPDNLYDIPDANQTADTPQNIAFVTVDSLIAKASSDQQIQQAISQIKGLLRERHHIHTPSEDDDTHDDFNIRDLTEIMHTMTQATGLVGILLLIVAAISLIVGGVGIMNIMLVSVTERDAGDRPAHGRRRAQPPHPAAIPRRGRSPLHGGRRHRRGLRLGDLDRRARISSTGPPASPLRWLPLPCWSRPAWASSSASTRPGRPRGLIRSKRCRYE